MDFIRRDAFRKDFLLRKDSNASNKENEKGKVNIPMPVKDDIEKEKEGYINLLEGEVK